MVSESIRLRIMMVLISIPGKPSLRGCSLQFTAPDRRTGRDAAEHGNTGPHGFELRGAPFSPRPSAYFFFGGFFTYVSNHPVQRAHKSSVVSRASGPCPSYGYMYNAAGLPRPSSAMNR